MRSFPAKAVVVGIDGTGSAHRALLWSAREAAARHLPLVVCHAEPAGYQGPDWEVACAGRNRARRAAVEGVRTASMEVPGLEAYPCSAPGSVSRVLFGAIAQPELFVLGSHGRSRSRNRVAGLLLTLAAHSGSAPPVVLVPSRARSPRGGAVLLAAGGEGDGEAAGLEPAARFAVDAAAMRGSRLVVIPTGRSSGDVMAVVERVAAYRTGVLVSVLDDAPVGGTSVRVAGAADHASLLVLPAGRHVTWDDVPCDLAGRSRSPVALVPAAAGARRAQPAHRSVVRLSPTG